MRGGADTGGVRSGARIEDDRRHHATNGIGLACLLTNRAFDLQLFTTFTPTVWWILLGPIQLVQTCAVWWLVRKHGFLAAWAASAALMAAGTAASMLVGWLLSGAGA